MKYFLIIERPYKHYQVSTQDNSETWSDMDEETLKDIIENWFYKTPSEDKGRK